MSIVIKYYVPDSEILREVGRLQIRHGHLDHMLRLVIKRMLGIAIDDPGYWDETHGMSKVLRDKARRHIDEKYKDKEDTAGTLNKVLDDAESATLSRNRLLHSVWVRTSDGKPVLHDRDNTLKMHVGYPLPTTAEIAAVTERVEHILRVLDHLTRK